MSHPLENDLLSIPAGDYVYPIRDFETPEVAPVEAEFSDDEGRRAIMELVDAWWGADNPDIDDEAEETRQLIIYLDRVIATPISGAGDEKMRELAEGLRAEITGLDAAAVAAGLDSLEQHANRPAVTAA